MPEDDPNAAQVKRLSSAIPTSRIETLVDGVFAIVMTVLVFDLRVPLEDQVVQGGLAHALTTLAPNFLSYVLTFVILGVLWVGHHNQYFYIRRADRVLLWINIFFLMAVSLLPFTAGLFARYGQDSLAIVAYNANLILAGLVLFLHWAYATRDNHLLGQKIEPEVRRIVSIRILTPPVLYGAAILVSLFSVQASILIDILVPIVYVLPNRIDRMFRREHSNS